MAEAAQAKPGCPAPHGSRIIARSAAAVVFERGSPPAPQVYIGCLRAVGRERLLERLAMSPTDYDHVYYASSAVVSAPYAALVRVWKNAHYGGQGSAVQVFDLRTGKRKPRLGGENLTNCPDFSGPCPNGGIDRVVLGSDGVSGAHLHKQVDNSGTFEAIQASDRTGVHTLDSVTHSGAGPALTHLKLTGNVLSWRHAGMPRSVTLKP